MNILRIIYKSTNGDNWLESDGWNNINSTFCCNWTGVICDDLATAVIIKLNLNENNLNGFIPFQIGNLSGLKSLSLENNYLHSSIPSQIGLLTKLSSFSFGQNQLTNSIPDSIQFLTNLESLYLSHNNLNFSIPSQIRQLTSLTMLYLNNNLLSKNISDSIQFLTNLQFLNFGDNQFTGSISMSLWKLTKLAHLDISMNQITGIRILYMIFLLAFRNMTVNFRRIQLSLNISWSKLDQLVPVVQYCIFKKHFGTISMIIMTHKIVFFATFSCKIYKIIWMHRNFF